MGPSPNTPYNPAAHGAPATILPEEVFGYIDVATLADIHRYLRESEAQDDIDLAAWIQDNYLYGIEKDQATAIIRTAQGFAQLDRAYRRVRSLTNKAQDKWPFFDRNFKEMSSATVRNNARGEAAPGVLYPIDSTQKVTPLTEQPGAASESNGLDMPDVSSTPKLQTPFVPVKPSGDQVHKQERTGLAPQTPIPFPSPPMQRSGSETHSIRSENSAKGHSKCSEIKADIENRATVGSEQPQPTASSVEAMHDSEIGVTHTAPKDIGKENPNATEAVQFSINGENDKPDHIRDAGRGKVRGPNGQYLPKDNVLPSGKKAKKPKGKGGKPSMKPVNLSETDATQSSPEKPENIFVQVQTPSTPPPDQKTEEQSTPTAAPMLAVSDTTPPLTAVNEAESHVASLAVPTPAYLLAAEADAVPSNLDRLPPNSRKAIKRKSEPTGQEGERKRGKYGGIVGRPRKSEQRETRKAVGEQGNNAETESSLQMTTRRSARRSAISNPDSPQSAEPTEEATVKDSKQVNQAIAEDAPIKEKTAGTEDEIMGGTEESKTTCHKDTSTPARNSRKKGVRSSADSRPSSATPKSKHATYRPGQRLKLNLDRTRPAGLGVQNETSHKDLGNGAAGSSIRVAPADTNGTNGTKRTHPVGHVELFARLTTSNGIIEVPIHTDQINSDEISMLEKYAEWNAQPNATPVPYDQFRQIFSFAKKD